MSRISRQVGSLVAATTLTHAILGLSLCKPGVVEAKATQGEQHVAEAAEAEPATAAGEDETGFAGRDEGVASRCGMGHSDTLPMIANECLI